MVNGRIPNRRVSGRNHTANRRLKPWTVALQQSIVPIARELESTLTILPNLLPSISRISSRTRIVLKLIPASPAGVHRAHKLLAVSNAGLGHPRSESFGQPQSKLASIGGPISFASDRGRLHAHEDGRVRMSNSQLKVLLVDDDGVDRALVRRLIGATHHILEARSISQAQALVDIECPSCVLLDHDLPNGDVLQLVRELVQKRVPVVILTRYGHESDAVRALKLGARDYLIKEQLRDDSLSSSIRFAIESQKAESTLRSDEARLRAVLESAVNCFIAVDRKARIVDVNLPAESIIGYSRSELVGQLVYNMLFRGKDRERVRRNLDQYLEDDAEGSMMNKRIVLPIVRKNQTQFTAEVLLCPLTLQQGPALLIFFYELSRRHRAELSLVQNQHELRAMIAERTAELRTAYERLQFETAERQRNEELVRRHRDELMHVARLNTLGEMAAGLAHELNQPLTAIVAHLAACRDTLISQGYGNRDVLDDLRQSIDQAHRAGEIIKRLRAMVGRQTHERQAVDLVAAIQAVLNLMDHEVRAAKVRIVLGRAPQLATVFGDRIQLEQVILNLVRNALEELQHVPAENRELAIVVSMTKDDQVQVSMRDQGRGLSPTAFERLFEPFYTTKPGGLGLGLSISRSIIESHHGQLIAEPNSPTGLVMTFTLPAGPADATTVTAPRQSERSSG
jgi:PAS domain S-box-containing protein